MFTFGKSCTTFVHLFACILNAISEIVGVPHQVFFLQVKVHWSLHQKCLLTLITIQNELLTEEGTVWPSYLSIIQGTELVTCGM